MSNYMEELERELRKRLSYLLPHLDEMAQTGQADEGAEVFIKFLKDKILESYKNGLEAGGSRASRKGGKTGQPPRNLPISSNKPKE